MVDIHCHIIPCVDDGAESVTEALELLKQEVEQGVSTVCLTPHLRIELFCSTDEKIQNGYRLLKEAAEREQLPLKLFVSREYFYEPEFCRRLERHDVIPLGECDVLLVEFDYSSRPPVFSEAARKIIDAGYIPMFAHVERYQAIQRHTALAEQLAKMGVLIQVNANSLLGEDGRTLKKTAWELMRKGVVNVVASDAHDLTERPLLMDKCFALLEKEIGRENADILMNRNPGEVLGISAD